MEYSFTTSTVCEASIPPPPHHHLCAIFTVLACKLMQFYIFSSIGPLLLCKVSMDNEFSWMCWLCQSQQTDTEIFEWDLCAYVMVHTISPPRPVILWIELGGTVKCLPLNFGYHDTMTQCARLPFFVYTGFTTVLNHQTTLKTVVMFSILFLCSVINFWKILDQDVFVLCSSVCVSFLLLGLAGFVWYHQHDDGDRHGIKSLQRIRPLLGTCPSDLTVPVDRWEIALCVSKNTWTEHNMQAASTLSLLHCRRNDFSVIWIPGVPHRKNSTKKATLADSFEPISSLCRPW